LLRRNHRSLQKNPSLTCGAPLFYLIFTFVVTSCLAFSSSITWKQKSSGFAGASALRTLLISFLESLCSRFRNHDLLLSETLPRTSRADAAIRAEAATGSSSAVFFLYFIARKGGERSFNRKAGAIALSPYAIGRENGFVGILISALCRPPPTPFKVFCVARGRFLKFRSGVIHPRLRCPRNPYFGTRLLRFANGTDALPYLRAQLEATVVIYNICPAHYLVSRLILHPKPEQST